MTLLIVLTFVFSFLAIFFHFLIEKFCCEEMNQIVNEIRNPSKSGQVPFKFAHILTKKGLLRFIGWVFMTNFMGTILLPILFGRFVIYLYNLGIKVLSESPRSTELSI